MMPNIEIFGYWSEDPVNDIRRTIGNLFANEEFAAEMVITHICSNVWDLAEQQQLYLRVWSSDEQEAIYIADVLRMEGFDVERPMKLAQFMSKPMWTRAEIMEDLTLVQQGQRGPSSIVGQAVGSAMQFLTHHHNFAGTADVYRDAVRVLEARLGEWRPDETALAKKVDPQRENINDGEDGAKARLTMIMQILSSLMPCDVECV